MRGRGWLLWGTATAVAVVLLAVFGLRSGRSAVARSAPPLPREHLAGAPVSLPSLLAGSGGRPALIVFWASWCAPCIQEAPMLERFSRQATGNGRIVGVDTGDAAGDARAFIHKYAWTFPNVRDGEGSVRIQYRVTSLPTTFVVDRAAHIRAELRGPQTAATLTRALASAERS
jgi:thiol-disulfide isomerase/thioredoxin